jgi:hypothetical protein
MRRSRLRRTRRGRPSPRGRHPPPSTAQREHRSRALHRIRRQGRTGGIALLGPRSRTTFSKVDPMRRASLTTKNAEGILHRRRASHAKHSLPGATAPWLKLSHVEQVPRPRRTCKEVDRAFHSRGTDRCGGTICCRVTSDLQIVVRTSPLPVKPARAISLLTRTGLHQRVRRQVTPQERRSGLTWLRF